MAQRVAIPIVVTPRVPLPPGKKESSLQSEKVMRKSTDKIKEKKQEAKHCKLEKTEELKRRNLSN